MGRRKKTEGSKKEGSKRRKGKIEALKEGQKKGRTKGKVEEREGGQKERTEV